MKKYIQYALRSEGVQQTAITLVGTVFAAGVAAVSLILFSRALGPSLFGEFSVGISIITILSIFNNGGLNTATIKLVSGTTDQRKKNMYFSITFYYKLIYSLIIGAVFLALTPWLTPWLKLTHPEIVILSLVLGYSASYYEHLIVMLHSTYRFTEAVYINCIQALVKLIGSVLLLATNSTDLTLAYIAYAAAPYVSLPFYKLTLPRWVKLNISKRSRDATKLVNDVAKHAALATISSGIIDSISIIFVQAYLTSYETGLLGGAQRIALLFTLIAASLGDVLFTRVAKYKSEQDLRAYMKKATLISIGASVCFLLTIPFSKTLILLTIGEQYLSGLPILNLLLASVFLQLATVPFLALFYTFETNWYFSAMGIVQLLATIIGSFLFIPLYGLMGAALVRLSIRVGLFIFTTGLAVFIYKQKLATIHAESKI